MSQIERNTKNLLLKALREKGDKPEDVSCTYSRGFPEYSGGQLPMIPSCTAADLPEGGLAALFCHSKEYFYTLVETNTEIKIETSPNTDPS